jgi:hypothetical protein
MTKMIQAIVRLLSAFILVVAWHCAIPAANAQQPALKLPMSAPSVSNRKLDATAAALELVAAIQQTYLQRVARAVSPSDRERIIAEARDARTKVVNDQGLSVEEYNSIIEIAHNDPEVRGKVLQRIKPRD